MIVFVNIDGMLINLKNIVCIERIKSKGQYFGHYRFSVAAGIGGEDNLVSIILPQTPNSDAAYTYLSENCWTSFNE